MIKVFITGSKGFIGGRLKEYLNDKYTIFTNDELNITNESNTLNYIKNIKPDIVIHSAAKSDTGFCETNRETCYNVNVNGAINIAKACNITNSKLVFFSSDQIYSDNSKPGPFIEESIVKPNNFYGECKLKAEDEIFNITENTWALRLTWQFDLPGRNKKINENILWSTIKKLIKSEKIYVPKNEYRGITYVWQLIENIEHIFNIPFGIYNAGSENNLERVEIVKHIFKILNVSHREEELLQIDYEKYSNFFKDIRIKNYKLKRYNILFDPTHIAIEKALKEYIP